MKSWSVTIQMKATEQYFPVVLFIMLYKVVLTFESDDQILKCDHSNESYGAVLSSTVYHVVKGGSYFWVCGRNLKMWPFTLLSLRGGGRGFPSATMNMTRQLLKENKRKIIPKETPSCSMIPCLLVVFTLQLEILGVVLTFASVGGILDC